MQQITDEQFKELIIRGELNKEVFNKLTLSQQQFLHDNNVELFNKMTKK